MKPVNFKEVNKTLKKPESMTDAECQSLPVFYGEGQSISKWSLTVWERIKILFTGKIWMSVFSDNGTQPPVWLSAKYPFEKTTKAPRWFYKLKK